MNDHVAEPFRSILNGFAGVKPSLQNQRVSNRSRYSILAGVQAELEAAGCQIDIGQLDWVTRTVEQRLYEASLDRQYEEEQAKKANSYFLGTKCWRDHCGHARGEHDEAGCRGGEDTICRCTDFEEPVENEQEAEREERRQYREWRNDSGV